MEVLLEMSCLTLLLILEVVEAERVAIAIDSSPWHRLLPTSFHQCSDLGSCIAMLYPTPEM